MGQFGWLAAAVLAYLYFTKKDGAADKPGAPGKVSLLSQYPEDLVIAIKDPMVQALVASGVLPESAQEQVAAKRPLWNAMEELGVPGGWVETLQKFHTSTLKVAGDAWLQQQSDKQWFTNHVSDVAKVLAAGVTKLLASGNAPVAKDAFKEAAVTAMLNAFVAAYGVTKN